MQTDQNRVSVADTQHAEMIGLPVALWVAFLLGTPVSAALPIVVALAASLLLMGLSSP
jgi:hypothetical protein